MKQILQQFKENRIIMFFSILSVIILITSTFVILSHEDIKNLEKNILPSSDDLGYYDYPGLGVNIYYGIDAMIVDDINVSIPVCPNELKVYTYEPLRAENITDLEKYLDGYSLNLTNYTFEARMDLSYPKFYFRNETARIDLVQNGAVTVEYNNSNIQKKEKYISEKEAYNIAEGFLDAHFGVPQDNYIRKIELPKRIDVQTGNETIIGMYIIDYYRVFDGYYSAHAGRENHILIMIDAYKGVIDYIMYHWPDFYEIDTLGEKDLGDFEDIISDYISDHNLQIKSNETVNITNVSIVYANTIGFNLKDSFIEGSPYYIYLPYIRLEWETGATYLSPLKT